MEKKNYKHRVAYEIFRYVDDYFIFYNTPEVKDELLGLLQIKLKEYKLSLNSHKQVAYEKPIITNISMAKQRISKLFDEEIKWSDRKSELTAADGAKQKDSIFINPKKLITEFKTALKFYPLSVGEKKPSLYR
jgi:hypothetical protein